MTVSLKNDLTKICFRQTSFVIKSDIASDGALFRLNGIELRLTALLSVTDDVDQSTIVVNSGLQPGTQTNTKTTHLTRLILGAKYRLQL